MSISDLTPHDGFDGHHLDAFGRLRVSNPTSLFEYTFKYNIDFDVYWGTETAAGGTVTHDADKVCKVLSVTGITGSKAAIQTRRRMQYYAGKSHLLHFSANFKGLSAGIRKRLGYYDTGNGYFFQADGATLGVVWRTKTSGSVVDNVITQANWNSDKLDGTGPSGVIADLNKQHLFWIDIAWLGAAAVRWGVYIDGAFIVVHHEIFANVLDRSFSQSGHLPFRYEIENTGGGMASTFEATCLAFEVEGFPADTGKVRRWCQGNTSVTISGEEVLWIGRINPLYKYASAKLEKLTLVIDEGSEEVMVRLYQNPTITSGAITWNDEPGSIMQTANSPNNESINTSTGFISNTEIITDDISQLQDVDSGLYFGFDIDDTSDIFVITATPLDDLADVVLNLTVREFY